METVTVKHIKFTQSEVKDILAGFNRDMMIDLIADHFGMGPESRRFTINQLAEFAEIVLDPHRFEALQKDVGIHVIETPTCTRGWRNVVAENPGLFIPLEDIENATPETLHVSVDGVYLNVEDLLNNV